MGTAMYKNDCKSIRIQLEEADLRQELNADTLTHLRTCRECNDFYVSELKLRQLISTLPAAEAPADFDFRLRARINRDQARPKFSLSGFGVPSLAAAALILVVAGVAAVRNGLFSGQTAAPIPEVQSSNIAIPSRPAATDAVTPRVATVPSTPLKNEFARTNKSGSASILAVEKRRPVSRDFSNVGAKSVSQDSALAGVPLPLSFPMQRLSVSVDDGSGVARTISFPTVSFGSERILTRRGNSFQGSAKSDW
ncbi:MAG: hypothetical protein C5B44_03595 [Acidobacteria bacterium]|nr:MAG: hypothetical protein C5B44_03595 [Acidobacteriota bacterium]